MEILKIRGMPQQEERPMPEGASEGTLESTDSGEYTIRDGSEPSSGGFQEGQYDEARAPVWIWKKKFRKYTTGHSRSCGSNATRVE